MQQATLIYSGKSRQHVTAKTACVLRGSANTRSYKLNPRLICIGFLFNIASLTWAYLILHYTVYFISSGELVIFKIS